MNKAESTFQTVLSEFAASFSSAVWGLPLVILLFSAGILFSFWLLFPQIKMFKHSIMIIFGKQVATSDVGELSHFQALCTALSATIGLGNIAGVAVAIVAGGPGAVFWMWTAGFLGMTTKLVSISLSLTYRNHDKATGVIHGGPMYTIKNGLPKPFRPLAYLFAIFTLLGALGIGNMFQSNQMASIVKNVTSLPEYASGIIFAILASLVLIGGIKRIGKVASALVPSMVVIYLLGSLGIILVNINQIPDLIVQIFTDAFTGTAAIGGFAGVGFKEVVIQGVRRAVFSNEAGLGSSAMAHAAAKSTPIQEGIVGMLEPFLDTIVVCSLSAFVILTTGVWSNTGGLAGSELTAHAFNLVYGNFGTYIVMISVILFAFSTIISWSYYGEQGVAFLFGDKLITPYRYLFSAFVFIGAIIKLQTVLDISDALIGLMAIPNILANILLMPKLYPQFKKYKADLKAGRI